MADEADKGNEAAELFLKSALYQRKRKTVPIHIKGIGICLYCLEEVEGDRRWCNAECRDEWEKENK